MEATVRVPDEDGRTEEGEGKEGLSLDLGYASSPHLCHQQYHKLIRTDAFPFRLVSRSPATDAAAAACNGRARSPPSPHTLAYPPNGGIAGGGGGTAFFTRSGISNSHGTPRTLQPFVAPFNSPGLSSDATLGRLYSPFTAAQWQELHRQALIFKYMMTSTRVPPELLFSPRALPDGHSLISSCRGGDYLNLRFAGTNGDVEPGRCRRTDGKKWRCSRDVALGQKYCERHVHRARPRSRKPVELDRRAGAAAAADDGEAAMSATAAGVSHATPTTTTSPSPAVARPCTETSPGVLPSGPDLRFPLQFMVPQEKALRYVGSGGGDAEAQAATQQWRLLHSKLGLRNPASVLQQQHKDGLVNLSCTSVNDHHGIPFLTRDMSAVEDVAEPPGRRDTPRRFIDASSGGNPYLGVTICDHNDGHSVRSASVRSLGNLPASNLTLSMFGSCASGGEDQDLFQMGLRATDAGKMMAPSWTRPVSPIGGPLAEVLQTSSTVSFRNEHGGRGNRVTRGGSAGLIDLMSKSGCDSEGTSPRDSTTRGFSSPTHVLHKTLVSLSDSSSNSNPAFAPGPMPELALQWASQSN